MRRDKAGAIQKIVDAIVQQRARYEGVGDRMDVNVPWYVIAVLHNMECSLDFERHLHNGDPLVRQTVHVPAGRPPKWNPTGSWEDSAADALQYEGFAEWRQWTIAGICYKLEAYNGWGYRRHQIHSPYLWSYSQHYVSGKYAEDHVWKDNQVSKQCGAAVLLRRLSELRLIVFPRTRSPHREPCLWSGSQKRDRATPYSWSEQRNSSVG